MEVWTAAAENVSKQRLGTGGARSGSLPVLEYGLHARMSFYKSTLVLFKSQLHHSCVSMFEYVC